MGNGRNDDDGDTVNGHDKGGDGECYGCGPQGHRKADPFFVQVSEFDEVHLVTGEVGEDVGHLAATVPVLVSGVGIKVGPNTNAAVADAYVCQGAVGTAAGGEERSQGFRVVPEGEEVEFADACDGTGAARQQEECEGQSDNQVGKGEEVDRHCRCGDIRGSEKA